MGRLPYPLTDKSSMDSFGYNGRVQKWWHWLYSPQSLICFVSGSLWKMFDQWPIYTHLYICIYIQFLKYAWHFVYTSIIITWVSLPNSCLFTRPSNYLTNYKLLERIHIEFIIHFCAPCWHLAQKLAHTKCSLNIFIEVIKYGLVCVITSGLTLVWIIAHYDLYDMCIYTQIHAQYTHTCITNKCKYLYLQGV